MCLAEGCSGEPAVSKLLQQGFPLISGTHDPSACFATGLGLRCGKDTRGGCRCGHNDSPVVKEKHNWPKTP